MTWGLVGGLFVLLLAVAIWLAFSWGKHVERNRRQRKDNLALEEYVEISHKPITRAEFDAIVRKQRRAAEELSRTRGGDAGGDSGSGEQK